MWWKYLLEAVAVLPLLMTSTLLWDLLRAPGHCRAMLANPSKLSRFLHVLGHEKVRQEADGLLSLSRSVPYERFIAWFHLAHFAALKQTALIFFALCAGILVGSYFMGLGYLAANVIIFFLPAPGAPRQAAKMSNLHHIHTVAINLLSWYTEYPGDCSQFCRIKQRELKPLLDTIVKLIPPD